MTDPVDPPPDPAPPGTPLPGSGNAPVESRPRAGQRRRRVGILLALVVLGLVAGELFARFYVGLGDPPLMTSDPEIEYLFKPDQECRRFGNRIRYNRYAMRADDFPERKSRPDEVRVLVIGDSVVNGGVLTDQSELATALIRRRLAEDLGKPVVVGNVSAGTWGPPNQLAYLKRFGLFDADVVVLVLSSHDYADVPTFERFVGVDPGAPDRKPVSALWEGVERYVLPRLRPAPASNEGLAVGTAPPKPEDVRASLDAVGAIIDLARRSGARVVVAQHLARDETLAHPHAGYAEIADTARAAGLTPVQLGEPFAAAKARGEDLYRDVIHPNARGQQLIADALVPAIKGALARGPATRESVR